MVLVAQQFAALVTLYEATNGPRWTSSIGWNDRVNNPDPCANWHGVKCDSTSTRVLDLDLHSNNIGGEPHGSLPTELGFLTDLTVLNFARNDLYGTLPTEIGRFSRLGLLNLEKNNIGGTLPSKARVGYMFSRSPRNRRSSCLCRCAPLPTMSP